MNLNVSPEQSQRAYLNIMEDMQGEKIAMEEQRIAAFNIMEDITQAQEELKKRYGELDTLKELVQELGSSLKTTAVLGTLVQSLKKILPASTNLAYVIPSSDPGKPSNLVYMHAVTPLSAAYLDAVRENIKLSFDLLPTKMQGREELVKWINGKFLFEFMGGTKDGDTTVIPLSTFNVPLIVGDEMLGVVNMSSPRSHLFTEKEIELANTMVGVTASTISRLRQLLESEQSRIQSLVESLSNGVVMFDLDQKVTMSNSVAQQMTGLPSQGFYLSEFIKLFTGAVAAATDKNLLASFETKITQTLETGNITHIEEVNISRFSYEVYVNPVRDFEKNIVGGAVIMHDITHIKEIDRMKTEFVSVASHQLRTPLTSINWYIGMLKDGDAGELEAMTNEHTCIMKFNKPTKRLPEIAVDNTLMRQVIHNLITNAIRYSPADKCSIIVSLEQKDGDYIVSVTDSGIGIPKEAQARIFEKFFRADNAQEKEAEGSGIGLYISKMIADASGGKLWFESSEGKGTTFYLSIPQTGMLAHEGERSLEIEPKHASAVGS